jgi:uncharacterized membrane protein YkoI
MPGSRFKVIVLKSLMTVEERAMNSKTLLAAIGLSCAVTAGYAAAPAPTAKVSMGQAITVAEEQGAGDAIDATYKTGSPGMYDIKVLSRDGKKLLDFQVNPDNGRVLKATRERAGKLFTHIKPADLQSAQTPLKGAIKTAEAQTGGKAVIADTDRKGESVQYTVKVGMTDGTTQTIKVNGADGKVAMAR